MRYKCGARYQDNEILYKGNKLYIRVRLRSTGYPIRFVLLSDAHNCGNIGKILPYLENESEGSNAIVSLGDSIVTDNLSDADEYVETWYNFIDKLGDLLYKNPFYPLLGNHDNGNLVNSASVGREAFLEVFELPKMDEVEYPYYFIDRDRYAIVFLDSNSLSIDETQLKLIDRTTTNSANKHSVLLLHHQILGVENRPTQGGASILDPAPKDFHEYLRSRGIDLVITGHRHFYHVYKKDEIIYITMPTICERNVLPNGSRVFDQNNGETISYNDNIYGYGVLEIYEERMVFTLKGYERSDAKYTEMETIEIGKSGPFAKQLN